METEYSSNSGSLEFLPYDYPFINEAILKRAETELGETEEKLREGLIIVKKFIQSEGIPMRTDDPFLILFLRGRKFIMKRILSTVRDYSQFRHTFMNYFGFLDKSKLLNIVTHNICGILPYRDANGRILLYVRTNGWSRTFPDFSDLVRVAVMILQLPFQYPSTAICGYSLFIDLSGWSIDMFYRHMKHLKILLPTGRMFPVRIHRIEIFNDSGIMHLLLKLVKPFVPAKLIKRVQFHGKNMEALKKYPYRSSILPYEFGGTLGPLSNDGIVDQFIDYLDTFRAENKIFKRDDTIPFPE